MGGQLRDRNQILHPATDVGWRLAEIQTGGPQATSATLTGPFGPGVAYSFQVEAYTGTDDEPVVYSAPSQTATVQAGQWPAAPTGLTTSVISNSEIDLTWTDTGTGATNYEIDRTTDGQTWTTVTDTLLPNATSYNDTRLTDGTMYGYRVQALNASGGSGYSVNAAATLPTAPTNLQANVVSSTEIDLSWTGSADSTGYTISVQPEFSTTWTVIGTVLTGATTYQAKELSPGTYYAFCVAPTNSTAESAVAYVDPTTLDPVPTIAGILVDGNSTPAPITGTTTHLTADAAGSGPTSQLTFAWSVGASETGETAMFSVNNCNAAEDTTVTFYAAGDYDLVLSSDRRPRGRRLQGRGRNGSTDAVRHNCDSGERSAGGKPNPAVQRCGG